MLTRNFLQMFGQSSGMGELDNTPKPIITTGAESGSATPVGFGYVSSSAYKGIFIADYWAKSKFVLGTGTTAAKSTDYKVESEITSGIDCSTLQKRYIQGTDQDHINISGVVTNSGTSAITFNEVGWYVKFYLQGTEHEAMLAREVLTEPITIEPGQSVAVNVRLM